MIAMGIDPGSQRTGWGVVRQEGTRLQLLAAGVLKTPAKAGLGARLAVLHAGLTAVLGEWSPDIAGMESVFYGPNVRSLVVLGQARGALMAAIGAADVPLVELSPSEVKKAVTGRGGAQKEQVSHMVGILLGPGALALAAGQGKTAALDATDALAVAVATLHRRPAGGRAPG